MEVWPYGDIESIRKKVFPGYHDVVDLMQKARIEMKAFQRPDIPRTNSIIYMTQFQSINLFFKSLKVKDLNSSLLIVNDELIIDAKAFLQMSQQDRDSLIEETKKLKTVEEFDAIKISPAASLVCHRYRLNFEKTRRVGILRLLTALQVKSREELSFGEIQFEKLEQNDVNSVIQVFKETGKLYNEKYSQVIRKMADRFKVDNVLYFVAVAEYAVRRINEEIDSLRRLERSPEDKPKGMKDVDYFLARVVHNFVINKSKFQDKICENFQRLLTDCAEHYPRDEPRFKTLIAAANHYDKHSREFPGIGNEPCSPEEYFERARKMCSESKLEENPTWTQDGSSISWQIKDNGNIAVRYDNPYKGTAVIATLHKPKKN